MGTGWINSEEGQRCLRAVVKDPDDFVVGNQYSLMSNWRLSPIHQNAKFLGTDITFHGINLGGFTFHEKKVQLQNVSTDGPALVFWSNLLHWVQFATSFSQTPLPMFLVVDDSLLCLATEPDNSTVGVDKKRDALLREIFG